MPRYWRLPQPASGPASHIFGGEEFQDRLTASLISEEIPNLNRSLPFPVSLLGLWFLLSSSNTWDIWIRRRVIRCGQMARSCSVGSRMNIYGKNALRHECASLAQSVERQTLNLKAAGSTPAWGFRLVLFHSFQERNALFASRL